MSAGGSDLILGGGGYIAGMPDPCKMAKVPLETRAVLLSDFYPHLAHGTYTLQTLAPRGTSERAPPSPITIKI